MQYLFSAMEQGEMAQVFDEWNKGELDSFLIEITRDILKFKDADGKLSLPSLPLIYVPLLSMIILSECHGLAIVPNVGQVQVGRLSIVRIA